MSPVISSRYSINTSAYINSSQQRSFATEEKLKFALPSNLREVLENVIENREHQKYQNLLCIIRDADISDSNMCALLQNCQELIPLLDHRLTHLVKVILMIQWTQRSDTAVEAFQNFLLDLCSAHNYHVQKVLEHLLGILKTASDTVWETEDPPQELQSTFSKIHSVIEKLLMLLPLSGRVLTQVAISCFPYYKRPAPEIQSYVHNLLQIPSYAPNIRSEILHLVITKLTALDSCAPREEVVRAEHESGKAEDLEFQMEVDGPPEDGLTSSEGMKHPLGNTLDILMVLLFRFLKKESSNEEGQCDFEKTKNVYKDMVKVFEQVSLSTTGACHTQFYMMYVCSLRPILGEAYLQFLWRLVLSVSLAPYIRQTAVAYIASFLARAKFVPQGVLKAIMQEMAEWIHMYIQCQDSLENMKHGVRPHAVFYSVCQALFYIVAFRHRDLVSTRNNVVFLEGLNMSKIVTSQLNPLKVCTPAIVSNFAAVTRTYQLVYCYSIIKRNSRHVLPTVHINDGTSAADVDAVPVTIDSYFPFDPYVLKRSSQFINPHYRTYQDNDIVLADELVVKKCEEDDDFLTENLPLASSFTESLFTYGTSPGFRQNH